MDKQRNAEEYRQFWATKKTELVWAEVETIKRNSEKYDKYKHREQLLSSERLEILRDILGKI